MKNKKPTIELSRFNADLIKRLADLVPGFEVIENKASVSLAGQTADKRHGFASIRKPGSRQCDVILQGYIRESSSLTPEQTANITWREKAGYYQYRTHDINEAVKALSIHFKDISKRVKRMVAGSGHEKAGRPRGLPPIITAD